MNKIIVMVLVFTMGIMTLSPSISYGSPFNRERDRYSYTSRNQQRNLHNRQVSHYNNKRDVRRHYESDNNTGLYVAGAVLGAVVLGTVLSSAVSQSGNAVKQSAYAAPSYSNGTYYNNLNTPPGQWVAVQGQWVNGLWVPAHSVWMPVNP